MPNNDLNKKCNEAVKNLENSETVVKLHTIELQGQIMETEERANGYVYQVGGNHLFNTYDIMVSSMSDDAKITSRKV